MAGFQPKHSSIIGADSGCDPAPLILTLGLEREAQARFDRLRAAHFPPERNLLVAHVTVFRHLPGAEAGPIALALGALCAGTAPFAVAVTGLRSLGQGVAFALASPELRALRSGLAATWSPWLTRQDQQGFRPHVTIQNKVSPPEAAHLMRELSAGFAPWEAGATGLLLWRYRGGPWDEAGWFPFSAPAAAPPAPRHRSPSSAPS